MNVCKIKNVSGGTDTLRGKEFSSNEVYLIPDGTRSAWIHDDVFQAISDEDYEIHDENGLVDDSHMIQWGHLKDALAQKAEISYDNQYTKQMDGPVKKTCTAGSTKSVTFQIVNHTGETYTEKYLWGGEILVDDNAAFADWAEFSVTDEDNLLGRGAGFELVKYVRKMYIGNRKIVLCKPLAPGAVPVGMYLKCVYHSTGSNNVDFLLNYDVNTKKD